MSDREPTEGRRRGLTRRQLLKRGAGAAAVAGLGPVLAGTAQAATGRAGKYTGTIRVLGLGVDLIDPIKKQAEKDLGFKLSFDVTDSQTMVQKAITQPGSFDVFSGYQTQIELVWPSNNMQPLEIARIPHWKEIQPLFKRGKSQPGNAKCTKGDGDAPFRLIYADPNRSGRWIGAPSTIKEMRGLLVQWVGEDGKPRGPEPKQVVGIPQNFNFDSMGYNTEAIPVAPEKVSWGELFNAKYKGKVALLRDPVVALEDTGNAAKALGLVKFKDLGNMTRGEIDRLTKILLKLKRDGQFRAFWTTFNESVNLMQSGEVVLESMWSPAVSLLQAQQFPVRYAAPPEGFRAWADNQMLAVHVKDPDKLQACYDYLNWWHQGFAGANMMRQGYYNAVQGTSKKFVSQAEWDFWIMGKPAAEDLVDPFGNKSIKTGTVRDGGSFLKRSCHLSSWNSVFEEQEYLVQRWNEFLTA